MLRQAVDYSLKKGVDYVEARHVSTQHGSLMMRNGKMENWGQGFSQGVSVRMLYDGSIGFASVTDPEQADISHCVDDAFSMARASSRISGDGTDLVQSTDQTGDFRVEPDVPFSKVPTAEKISLFTELDQAFKESKGVEQRVFRCRFSNVEKHFVNSEGSSISQSHPYLSVFLLFKVKHGKGVEQSYLQRGGQMGWEYFRSDELLKDAKKEVEVLKNAEKAVSPPEGKIDLVIGPEVAGIAVHESVGHPYETDRIMGRESAQAGGSFVNPSMLGERIGSSAVNVCDDPTLPGLSGHFFFDDEGIRARKKRLVEKGIISQFLQNRETAFHMQSEANGSARAQDFDKEPIVRMSNTYLEPGDSSLDEMIAEVKTGVFINSFSEWNIDDERFNQKYVGKEAYLIENGEVTVPVKKPALEITTPAFYSAIELVGSREEMKMFPALCGKGDPYQPLPVSMGGSPALLRNIRMGVSE